MPDKNITCMVGEVKLTNIDAIFSALDTLAQKELVNLDALIMEAVGTWITKTSSRIIIQLNTDSTTTYNISIVLTNELLPSLVRDKIVERIHKIYR